MALGKKFRRYRGWIAIAVVVAIGGTAFAMMRSANAEENPSTTYTTSPAEKGTLSVTVSGTGNLELADTTEVWPDVAGTVESVAVEEGDTVKAGELLFTLDDAGATAATAKALASYRQAQSQVAQVEAQLARANSSLASLKARAAEPSSTVTSAELTAAKADVASAKASLASAKASRTTALTEYEDAQDAEDDLEVTSPSAGRVYSLAVEAGDAVSTSSGSTASGTSSSASIAAAASSSAASSAGSSTPPLVLVGGAPLIATLAVNEVDLPSLKVGQRADLEFDALPDLQLTGKVTDISDEGTVESGVVSFDIEITLDVANAALKPGMSVSATVVTAVARDALLVPNAAVKSDTEGSYVQVLDSPSGTPRDVRIEVGLSGDTKTQVVSGLDEGAKVVTATNDASDSSDSARPGGMMMMGGGPGR